MKTTTDAAVAAYRLLNTAKTTRLEPADHILVIRALRPLKKVATEWDDFTQEAVKRLRPEGYDATERKMTELRALPAAEQEEAVRTDEAQAAIKAERDYSKAIEDCLKDELAKEVELDLAPLGDETLGRLLASNDWTVADSAILADILTAKD